LIMLKHIPNTITLGNLFCGCMGIAFVHSGNLKWAALMVLAAAVLDFFDGFTARLLKVKSELGGQLDSLSDLVSFGVLPAYIAYSLFDLVAYDERWARIFHSGGTNSVGLAIFIFALAAALRLAIFNVSSDQTTSFKGLPSPAAGIYLSSFALIYFWGLSYSPIGADLLESYCTSNTVILASALGLAALMLLPIRLLALKFTSFGVKENITRYLLIIFSIVLVLIFGFLAIQLIVLLYLILSLIQNLISNEIQS